MSLEQRAWSRGAAGVGAGPTRDPGKHLFFFSFVYFVCLWSCAVAQHSEESNTVLQCSGAKEGDGSNGAITFFSSLCCKKKRRRRRRWQHCCCCLLFLPAMELHYRATPRRRQQQLLSPFSAWCGATLQRSSTKKATAAAQATFALVELRYSAA